MGAGHGTDRHTSVGEARRPTGTERSASGTDSRATWTDSRAPGTGRWTTGTSRRATAMEHRQPGADSRTTREDCKRTGTDGKRAGTDGKRAGTNRNTPRTVHRATGVPAGPSNPGHRGGREPFARGTPKLSANWGDGDVEPTPTPQSYTPAASPATSNLTDRYITLLSQLGRTTAHRRSWAGRHDAVRQATVRGNGRTRTTRGSMGERRGRGTMSRIDPDGEIDGGEER